MKRYRNARRRRLKSKNTARMNLGGYILLAAACTHHRSYESKMEGDGWMDGWGKGRNDGGGGRVANLSSIYSVYPLKESTKEGVAAEVRRRRRRQE